VGTELVQYSSNMDSLGGKPKAVLSVVTPISKMAGKLENLREWLHQIRLLPIQAVIVHDVQDDETGPQLDALISELDNPRIILIHKFCGSPGSARNLGLVSATSDWICFWDSDDRPRVKEFLEMILTAADSKKSFCVGSYLQITPTSMQHQLLRPKEPFEFEQLLGNPGIWRMGFNRNLIEGKRFVEYRMAEDQYFICSLNLSGADAYISEKPVYEYFSGFGNQLTNSKTALDDLPKVLELILSLADSSDTIEQNSFINTVVAQVSLTGIKKASIITKIKVIKMLAKLPNSSRSNITKVQKQLITKKLKKLLPGTKPPSVRVKLYGGLGNQLFQFTAALAISGDRRLILELNLKSSDGAITQLILPPKVDVEIRSAKNLESLVFLKVCNLNLRLSTIASPSFPEKMLKTLFEKTLTLILCIKYKSFAKVVAPMGLGYSNIASPRQHLYLLGYFQSYIWSENFEVRNQLWNMRLQRRSIPLDEMLQEINSKKVLGVHVRLGDYLNNPQFGQLTPDYYRKAIQQALGAAKFEELWIFSNNMVEARSKLKFLNDFGMEVKWVNDSELSSSEVMTVLSNCSGLILSNSSFGWWGARLSQIESQLVLAPKPWFEDIESPRLLIPDNWIQIDALYGKSET
jgi:glycosyltransferase involved in cell wall biosynthesis